MRKTKKLFSFLEAIKLVEQGYKVRNRDWPKNESFIKLVKPNYRVKLNFEVRNNAFIAKFHINP